MDINPSENRLQSFEMYCWLVSRCHWKPSANVFAAFPFAGRITAQHTDVIIPESIFVEAL
jgi:hypothetical protein